MGDLEGWARANLNSEYQISYRLIFVPVSPDLTSRHVSKVRSMLEVGKGEDEEKEEDLQIFNFSAQTLARRGRSQEKIFRQGLATFQRTSINLV